MLTTNTSIDYPNSPIARQIARSARSDWAITSSSTSAPTLSSTSTSTTDADEFAYLLALAASSRPVNIHLTPDDISTATNAARQRGAESRRLGLTPRGLAIEDIWAIDLQGTLCEAAVARFLGLEIGTALHCNTWHGADVGSYQVRGTRHPNGRLIVRHGDAEGVYILVTGEGDSYRIVGWQTASYVRSFGRLETFGLDREPVWALSQGSLRPMRELPRGESRAVQAG